MALQNRKCSLAKKGLTDLLGTSEKEAIPAIDKVFVFGNYAGSTVAPGTYTIRLSLAQQVVETTAVVKANPKIEATPAQYQEQQAILDKIDQTLEKMHVAVNQMRSVKKQLQSYKKRLSSNPKAETLLVKGDSLIKRITTWEEHLIQPNQKTFQDVINFHNQLNADFLHLKSFIDVPEPTVTNGMQNNG